jgi:iron complex outermembrane receptor protein
LRRKVASWVKEYDGSFSIGINKKWGFSNFSFSTFNQTLNITEGDRDSIGNFIIAESNGNGDIIERSVNNDDLSGYKIGFPHQEINHIRFVSNTYLNFDNSSLNFDLAYQQNNRKEFTNPALPDELALYFNLNTYNYSIKYNLPAIDSWENSIGISGIYQSNENKGLEFLVPEYNLFDVGGFIFTQKHILKDLVLAMGFRFDNRSISTNRLILDSNEVPVNQEYVSTKIKFPGFNESYSGISGSAGLSYQIDANSTLKFNLSSGFRSPNIAEIGSNGKHEGTFRYEYGTPDLSSENSFQLDLAYFLHTEHFTLELTPFYNTINNYIFLEKLSGYNGSDSIPDPKNPAEAFKYKQGNANIYGGEIYIDLHPHPLDWLHFENSFSYVRAIQSNQPDSTKNLPLIPAPHFRGELKAQFKSIGELFKNPYIRIGLDYDFEQNNYFSAYNTETGSQAYTLINTSVGISFNLFNESEHSTLLFSIENLTDKAYQNHLSRLKYAPVNPATGRVGIFNMGRNFNIKLIVHL